MIVIVIDLPKQTKTKPVQDFPVLLNRFDEPETGGILK